LVYFCNSIHDEISQLIDNPFAIDISQTSQKAYDLNPSDIKIQAGSFLGIPLNISLTKIIKSSIIDEDLKKDFKNKYKKLDRDKPSTSLKDSIKNAYFWENEYEKSNECQKIAADIFTPKVCKEWPNLTENKKKDIIEQYVNKIGNILGSGTQIVKEIKYDADGFGYASPNGTVSINDDFVTTSNKNYSVDKMIDTLTHETRHVYQFEVKDNPKKYGVSNITLKKWEKPYVSSSKNYNKYYEQEVEKDARSFAALSKP
jgi:hypothetical protein